MQKPAVPALPEMRLMLSKRPAKTTEVGLEFAKPMAISLDMS